MAAEDLIEKLKQEACEELDRICGGREVWQEGGFDYIDNLELDERASCNFWYGQYLATTQMSRDVPTGRRLARSEIAAILVGLRLLQGAVPLHDGILRSLLTDRDSIPPITKGQIGRLCELINCEEVMVHG